MNRQIFHLIKYDLKGHCRLQKSSNFSVNPTLPLMDGTLMIPSKIVCISLSLTLHLVLYSLYFSFSLSTSLFCSMQTLIYILKGHMRPLLFAWFLMIFRSFDQIIAFTFLTLTYVLMDNFLSLFRM